MRCDGEVLVEASESFNKKPNWVLIKEVAEELYRSGKIAFTRKELASKAHEKDPSRSEMSLDFEVDLVTVNSSSKDKYKDPEKLFLFRLDRGRYTLYNPEEHGELDKYTGIQRVSATRKQVLKEVLEELERLGYEASENKYAKALQPDIIASTDDSKTGVWVIDPGVDTASQYKSLAYAIGSCMLNRGYNEYLIVLPEDLHKRITQDIIDALKPFNVRFVPIREERKYTLQI
ncbi:MAG: hypothetical protein QXY95_04990 [Thermosphaera sp.]